MDAALLILRLAVGLYVFGHGAQKMFGWFGGSGFTKTLNGMIAMMGFQPGRFWALMSGVSEMGGGLLLALGLLSPLGTFGVVAAMLTAIFAAHWRNGLWNAKRGIELPFTYLVVAVAIGLAGPGSLSLDRVLGIRLPEPLTWIVLLALVLAGVALGFGTRKPAQQQAAQSGGQSRPASA
jgi:putative oxidoreductase